jgi:hypothetical protein
MNRKHDGVLTSETILKALGTINMNLEETRMLDMKTNKYGFSELPNLRLSFDKWTNTGINLQNKQRSSFAEV